MKVDLDDCIKPKAVLDFINQDLSSVATYVMKKFLLKQVLHGCLGKNKNALILNLSHYLLNKLNSSRK